MVHGLRLGDHVRTILSMLLFSWARNFIRIDLLMLMVNLRNRIEWEKKFIDVNKLRKKVYWCQQIQNSVSKNLYTLLEYFLDSYITISVNIYIPIVCHYDGLFIDPMNATSSKLHFLIQGCLCYLLGEAD